MDNHFINDITNWMQQFDNNDDEFISFTSTIQSPIYKVRKNIFEIKKHLRHHVEQKGNTFPYHLYDISVSRSRKFEPSVTEKLMEYGSFCSLFPGIGLAPCLFVFMLYPFPKTYDDLIDLLYPITHIRVSFSKKCTVPSGNPQITFF